MSSSRTAYWVGREDDLVSWSWKGGNWDRRGSIKTRSTLNLRLTKYREKAELLLCRLIAILILVTSPWLSWRVKLMSGYGKTVGKFFYLVWTLIKWYSLDPQQEEGSYTIKFEKGDPWARREKCSSYTISTAHSKGQSQDPSVWNYAHSLRIQIPAIPSMNIPIRAARGLAKWALAVPFCQSWRFLSNWRNPWTLCTSVMLAINTHLTILSEIRIAYMTPSADTYVYRFLCSKCLHIPFW